MKRQRRIECVILLMMVLFVSACATFPKSRSVSTKGLVRYFSFDRPTGEYTIHGSPEFIQDIRKSVCSFDGENDWIDCGVSNEYSLSSDLTLTAWIKDFDPNDGYSQILWYGDKQSAKDPYQIALAKNRLVAVVDDSAGRWKLTAKKELDPKRWTFVAMTAETLPSKLKQIKAYINDELVSEMTTLKAGEKLELKEPHLTIACWGEGTGKYKGSLDDIRLYGRVLSEREIVRLYQE